VQDAGVVDLHVTGREDDVDGLRLVHVDRALRAEDALDRGIHAQLVQFPAVTAGDQPQAPVLGRRVVNGDPEGHHVHRLQRPERRVLVPQDRLARPRRLADVVRGEQRDVRPHVGLGDVEQAGVADQPDPERIVGHQPVPELLRAQLGVLLLEPVDMAAGLLSQVVVEHAAVDDVAVAPVLLGRRGGTHTRMTGH
jgi:hypothetical protein